MKTEDVIGRFKKAGFSGRVFEYSSDALAHLRDIPKERHVLCPYKVFPRRIHPAVCQWHRDQKDPECLNCKNNRSH